MTFPTTAYQHPDQDVISWMSDEQYLAYQRCFDDELIERYYSQGLTPPGMTPMPSAVAGLEPPF